MAGRTALYRIYDRDGILLYVGISRSFGRRWSDESHEKPWWGDVQRMTVDWYPTRQEAEIAESRVIRSERPVHNVAHNRPRPALSRKPSRAPSDPYGLARLPLARLPTVAEALSLGSGCWASYVKAVRNERRRRGLLD